MRLAGNDIGQNAREDPLLIQLPLAAAERTHDVDQQPVDRAYARTGIEDERKDGEGEDDDRFPDTPTPKKITSSGANATSGLA